IYPDKFPLIPSFSQKLSTMCITFVDWWIKAVHYLYKNLAIHKYFRLLLIISPALPLRFDLLSIIAYNLSRFIDNYRV
ncbi:hypothetical protein, partial [Phascolarctobacterium succinatutens]|uniref:hypothetical protein n=1 Tax=Phascolarctobacterium succinatutens TaxID=626940 RepID=UPI003AF739A6